MSKLPIFEHFLSVENLKPKLKWFFKPKLKPNFFFIELPPWLTIAPPAPFDMTSPSTSGHHRMSLKEGNTPPPFPFTAPEDALAAPPSADPAAVLFMLGSLEYRERIRLE